MQPNQENNVPNRPVVTRRPVSMGARPAGSAAAARVPVDAGPTFDNGPSVVGSKGGRKTGWILAIILLLLIAAGGVGFGVWAYMDSNNAKNTLNAQIAELQQQNTELQAQMSSNISTSSDAWDNYVNGLINQNVYVMGYYWHYNGSDNEQYVAYAMKDNDGHLVITDAGNNMGTDNPVITELDDVLAVYYIRIGNGSVPYFYIIDTNGVVSRINISEDSDRQLEKVGDYNKIVTVLEAASMEAILVDINGNIYKSA